MDHGYLDESPLVAVAMVCWKICLSSESACCVYSKDNLNPKDCSRLPSILVISTGFPVAVEAPQRMSLDDLSSALH